MADQNFNNDAGIPLSKVVELRSRGTPNNQIIQMLQSEGYSSDQIFDAMNQADMQQNVGQGVADSYSGPQGIENPMQMQPGDMQPPQQQFQQSQSNYGGGMSNDPNREAFEETAEAIINEKWKQVSTSINRINEWKDKLEHRMSKIETDFSSLQQNFDKLHQALIGKIGEYDKNILNVGTEIKAMEKVFQKILPTFTENVNELSRMTENMKKK